jgi:hypothetical protein
MLPGGAPAYRLKSASAQKSHGIHRCIAWCVLGRTSRASSTPSAPRTTPPTPRAVLTRILHISPVSDRFAGRVFPPTAGHGCRMRVTPFGLPLACSAAPELVSCHSSCHSLPMAHSQNDQTHTRCGSANGPPWPQSRPPTPTAHSSKPHTVPTPCTPSPSRTGDRPQRHERPHPQCLLPQAPPIRPHRPADSCSGALPPPQSRLPLQQPEQNRYPPAQRCKLGALGTEVQASKALSKAEGRSGPSDTGPTALAVALVVAVLGHHQAVLPGAGSPAHPTPSVRRSY